VGPIKENSAAFYLRVELFKKQFKGQIKKKNVGLLKENPAKIYVR